MNRQAFVSAVLVILVSIPGFLIGHKLSHGDKSVAALSVVMMMVVLLASAIMRQLDQDQDQD